MRARVLRMVVLSLAVAACEHAAPFDVPPAEPRGPFDAAIPRRLTFNTGDDRTPVLVADTVIFSRFEPAREDQDRCFGFLPVAGGVLARSVCPGGPLPDDRQQIWSEPAVSPDGARIAYIAREGPIGSASTGSQVIVVAPLSAPGEATATFNGRVVLPDGREAAMIRRLRWPGGETLRFIAGVPDPVTNAFTPFAVVELDIASGAVSAVAGVDEPAAYATAPDGSVWYVSRLDPTLLLQVPPESGTPAAVGRFSAAVIDLENGDGVPVAVTEAPAAVEWLDLLTGTTGGVLWRGATPLQVASAPGTRRVVAEIASGGAPDLWLLVIPGPN